MPASSGIVSVVHVVAESRPARLDPDNLGRFGAHVNRTGRPQRGRQRPAISGVEHNVVAVYSRLVAPHDDHVAVLIPQADAAEQWKRPEIDSWMQHTRSCCRRIRTVDADFGTFRGHVPHLNVLAEDEPVEVRADRLGETGRKIDQHGITELDDAHVGDHPASGGQERRVAAGTGRQRFDVVRQEPLEVGTAIRAGQQEPSEMGPIHQPRTRFQSDVSVAVILFQCVFIVPPSWWRCSPPCPLLLSRACRHRQPATRSSTFC